MFSFLARRSSLMNIASFAGTHMALVSQVLTRDGFLNPCGMLEQLSLLAGATHTICPIVVDDPDLTEAAAEHWFLSDHGKARVVSVALDTVIRSDGGARKDAIGLSARSRDGAARILLFLPYVPATDSAPIRFDELIVDFPKDASYPESDRAFALRYAKSGLRFNPHRGLP